MRIQGLYINKAGKKGRGVFTKNDILANTIIETAPVIILSETDRKKVEETKLFFYIFEWGKDAKQGILALGYVSMYNHSSPSNCEYEMDYKAQTISVISMRDIKAGEEITINYSAGWDDWEPVWFEEEKAKQLPTKGGKKRKKAIFFLTACKARVVYCSKNAIVPPTHSLSAL